MPRLKDMTPEEKRAYNCACAKRWRDRNPEKVRERRRQIRELYPDKLKEYKKRWEAKNPDKVKAMKKRYRAKHAAHIFSKNDAYQKANRDKCRAWNRAAYKRNPENAMNSVMKRRGIIAARGRLTRGLTKRLMISQCGKCAKCSADLAISGHHRDHIIPLARGGAHVDANIQLLCPPCNLSKGAKLTG